MSLRRDLLREIEASPLPIPTADLVAICATGRSNSRPQTWAELRALERDGFIVRHAGKDELNRRKTWWAPRPLGSPAAKPLAKATKSSSRYDYNRYHAAKAAGICVHNGCSRPSDANRVYCREHRLYQARAWKGRTKRKSRA